MGNIAQNPIPFYLFVNSFPALLVVYDLWIPALAASSHYLWCGAHDHFAARRSSPGANGTDRTHNRLVAKNLTGADSPIHFGGESLYTEYATQSVRELNTKGGRP